MKKQRRNLPLLLLSVRERVRQPFQPVFRQFGITEQQWRILRQLYERHDMGVTQIADACLILAPSIVGIIPRMETMGLVERKTVATDRRRANISLTPKGREMVEQILPVLEVKYRELEETLGSGRMQTLFEVLDEVDARLAEAHAHLKEKPPR
jgi:homoprotocatechuate degradation regulator HpaR